MKGAQRPCNFHDKGQDRLKRLLVFFIHLLHLHLFINSMYQHCESLFVKELNFFCGSFRRKFPPLSILLGSLPNGRLPKLLHSLYSAVPAEGDSRHIFILLRFPAKQVPATSSLPGSLPNGRLPHPLHSLYSAVPSEGNSRHIFYSLLRFPAKQVPATSSFSPPGGSN